MKIKTAITEMLGIDLPIIGAPMFLVSYPDLVVAVSEAGGIGCFPAFNYRTIPELRAGLAEIRARTNKPIGVNLVLHKGHNPKWPEQLAACLESGVELLITSLGTPRTAINEARAAGAKIFCDVTTIRHASIVARAGADALIAVAQGAGGHAGAVSPMALIPRLKSEFSLPVIAAGSVGTGAQMAAALALGADAVYVGTRLIATPEARTSDAYKQMIVDSASEDIVYTDRVSGIPANWLKKSIDKIDSTPPGDLELAANTLQPVDEADEPTATGDEPDEFKRWRDIWSAGHGVAQIDDIVPAGDIVRRMAAEYDAVRRRLPALE